MLPINIDDAGMKMLADAFGSTMGTFTLVFLLAPLGTTRPRIQDLTALVTRVGRN
jgi:hypothetical protein